MTDMHATFPPLPPRDRQRSASTLAATMLVIAAIVTLLSLAAYTTSQFGRLAGRQQGVSDTMAAADAALEYAYTQWKSIVRSSVNGSSGKPAAFTAAMQSTAINTAGFQTSYNALTGGSFVFTGGSTSGMVVTAVDQNGLNTGTIPASPGGTVGTLVPPKIATQTVQGYPGWTGYNYNYMVTVKVTNPNHYGTDASQFVEATRYFQVTQVPLFQAAIFYENKLEIHPGSAMTVSGLVHTNGDMWAQGFDVLQFKSNVSYVGAYHEAADTSVTQGWDGYGYGMFPGSGQQVTWADNKTSSSSTTKSTQLNQVSAIDPFGGASTNNNGLHDIVEVPAATNTSTQIAYNNAALRIVINSAAGTTLMTYSDGTALSTADTTAVNTALNATAPTTIYDQREASNVTVTSLDMNKLSTATTMPATASNATKLQTLFNANGVHGGTVYIHDVNPTSKAAIRLVDGRNLGENVSVVSDNGVYIQGDYNTGGNVPSDVPSNVSNNDGSATPQASNYDMTNGVSSRYSSAVMADAVTILSNSWQDGNSSKSLSNRTATATTVNTAILAGDVPSNYYPGNASGGAHNFPRFLENWNNVNFTYWGSLVEAYRSESFMGRWQTGNVYYWPGRKWNFDTNFLNNPPLGAPQGLLFTRGRWERTYQ